MGQRENRGDKGASDTQTGLTGDLEADPVGQAPSTPLCKHIIASFGFKLSRKLQIVRTRKDLRALSVEPIICTKAETIKIQWDSPKVTPPASGGSAATIWDFPQHGQRHWGSSFVNLSVFIFPQVGGIHFLFQKENILNMHECVNQLYTSLIL